MCIRDRGGSDQGSGDSSAPGTDGGGSNTDQNEEENAVSKAPSITCDLKDGQEISGKSLTMKVKVKDYKNNYLSSFYVEVYVNGTKIGSSGTVNHTITYRYRDLQDGDNEVVIKARDEEGNIAQKTYRVIADADAAQKIGGTVTITVEANVLNLGTFVHKTTEFYDCLLYTSGAGISFEALRILYITGAPYDLMHAGTATLCVFLFGNSMIKKLERIKIKYGIYK